MLTFSSCSEPGLPTAVASLVAEHRLSSAEVSVVAGQGFSCMWNLPHTKD